MVLDRINTPADLKELSEKELVLLCQELRQFAQEQTREKEGHIRSSLGVTELTVALHYLLDTPVDKLIWDVGHQAYIHKILTSRKANFSSNRKLGGISGFTSRTESAYDPFGAGHSSTSISAAVGFALADRVTGHAGRKVVAVIGDGAITGGMSFEALNHLGEAGLDVLIVLNDNNSSIDENRGALAAYDSYDQYCKALGIHYLGDVDGHDMSALLTELGGALSGSGPRMIKVATTKGKGRIDSAVKGSSSRGYQHVLGEELVNLARKEQRLVVISPAMLSGGGLNDFAREFPDRCFDVGIAEQHAVTLAAGMAANGLIPVVHLYSTFAQRAYDQIIHDVALQKLHVIFIIDRAGLVGSDGSTHHGAFDPGFFNTIPNLRIMSPVGSSMLKSTLEDSIIKPGPQIIRIPKADLNDEVEVTEMAQPIAGVYQLKQGSKALILSFGSIAATVQEALQGLDLAHIVVNQLKPFPGAELCDLISSYPRVITIEENSARGGLGDTLRAFMAEFGLKVEAESLSLPDEFIPHGTRNELLEQVGLDKASLIRLFSGLSGH